jgi:hypothetical protein
MARADADGVDDGSHGIRTGMDHLVDLRGYTTGTHRVRKRSDIAVIIKRMETSKFGDFRCFQRRSTSTDSDS